MQQENLPITIWHSGKNFYKQSAVLSWMADHVRDIMDPDFILFLDSDEIILCDSADDLVRDFDAIPPGQVGALPWVTFVPKPNLKRAPFNPGNFRERLTSEFQQFYKIVLPRGAPLAPGNGISDGAHLAIGLDHKPIEQHRLSEAALAHVPARNRDQVVERAFFRVTSVNVVEIVDGLWVATAQGALGGSCGVSLVSGGLSISPMASTPM